MNRIFKSTYHVSIVSLYILFLIYVFLYEKSLSRFFFFEGGDIFWVFITAVISLPVLFLCNYFLSFGELGFNQKKEHGGILIFLYASVLIALPEEILFRGIIQTYFDTFFENSFVAIVLSSVVFGLAHSLNGAKKFLPKFWNWKLVTITFVAGLFLGWLLYITNNLVAPIILHTFFIVTMKIFIKETKRHQLL